MNEEETYPSIDWEQLPQEQLAIFNLPQPLGYYALMAWLPESYAREAQRQKEQKVETEEVELCPF